MTLDLDGVEIGTSIHISAISLPAGVTPTITDRDFTVATIAGSAAAKSDASSEDGEADEGGGGEAAG